MRRSEEQQSPRVRISEDNLICPITQEIMRDPVMAQDGITYEREKITEWVEKRHDSPITRQPMEPIFLPNLNIKNLIEEYNSSKSSSNDDASEGAQAVVDIDYYNELLENLATSFSISRKEMWHKNIVEQTLVALADIYTDQDGASFDKDNKNAANWNLRLCLNFSSAEEHQLFTFYYRNKYAGSIIKDGGFNNYKAEVIFDPKILYEQIAPDLAEYKKNSHTNLMKELSSKLNVNYEEVFSGDAVERRLVGQAGIFTSQKKASYCRNEDYTTRFNLSFLNANEYAKFTEYYRNNYPDFIIREYPYKAEQLCKIDVNTKLLITQIASKLDSDFVKPAEVQTGSWCSVM
ncbi:MAG: Ubox domain containing protein [Candidatus Midichloriaceae bacterium]|jgi:hypothetical protein|nr:Ubox domain containing protein [Candidatus Midichloriaceae bacterium]